VVGGALALLVIAGSAIVANAASLGTLNADTLGTSADVYTNCTGISMATRSRYSGGNTYDIGSIVLTGVPTACQSKNYQLTIAQKTTGASITQVSGTTSASATTTVSIPAGNALLIDIVSPGEVQVVVVISS